MRDSAAVPVEDSTQSLDDLHGDPPKPQGKYLLLTKQFMKFRIVTTFLLFCLPAIAHSADLILDHVADETVRGNALTRSRDIGAVALPGKANAGNTPGAHILKGCGADIQGESDAFHFAYTTMQGDGSITARVKSIVETNKYAKGGVMLRESLDPGSRHVMMHVKASTGSEFQFREYNNRATIVGERVPAVRAPYWVRLERRGDLFNGYTSQDGVTWQLQDATNIPMPATIFVGLAVTSHNNKALTTVEFADVAISGEVSTPDVVQHTDTGVTGFIPLLSAATFDPYTDDGQSPSDFFSDNDEFYTYRGSLREASDGTGYDEDEGKDPSDENVVFRLTPEGVLHILGIPESGQQEQFGYISTEDNYRNYHLSLEYKWGSQKFKPRDKVVRDSGLIYHSVGTDVTWPTGVETQIQEGDTGDFFFLGYDSGAGRANGTVTVVPSSATANRPRYLASGTAIDTGGGITKDKTVDSLTDWNRVEVIVEQDDVVAIVNGMVVNRATNARHPEGGIFVPLTEGRIALQAEGAEVFYRNVQIKPTHATGGLGEFRVLVFQESQTHELAEVTKAALQAIRDLGASQGFVIDVANNSTGQFTEDNLRQYAAIVWNSVSGDVLNNEEQDVFRRYLEAGGGFVGLHAAAKAEPDWEWYGDLVGAREADRTRPLLATLRIDSEASIAAGGSNLQHPAVDALPQKWQRVDRWPFFKKNPRLRVNVLLTLDESNHEAESNPNSSSDRPMVWWHDFDGGRSFYSGLGLRAQAYSEPLYLEHLLGGIEYAAGVSRVAPQEAVVLFDGSSTSAFQHVDGKDVIDWTIDDDGSLVVAPHSGNIETKQVFLDYRLHLEFKVPVTAPGTAEQQRGNSGLYLYRSYELQILDSYGDPNFDARHAGALYNVKAANTNASLPAETWQTYDVLFHAPQYNDQGGKTANARVTAYLNGKLIHKDVEIPGMTRGGLPEQSGPQPFFLQAHDAKSHVKFRNIWLLPIARPSAALDEKEISSVQDISQLPDLDSQPARN